MTAKQRTASEIRAYCEELEKNLGASKGKREQAVANYVSWGINARADMLPLLDAAAKLRYELGLLRDAANDMGCFGYGKRVADVLDKTVWLEE